jgi:hypothetical protein
MGVCIAVTRHFPSDACDGCLSVERQARPAWVTLPGAQSPQVVCGPCVDGVLFSLRRAALRQGKRRRGVEAFRLMQLREDVRMDLRGCVELRWVESRRKLQRGRPT